VSAVHLWDALTREEIAELAPDALLVLPVGTTEQHGPHLATCTDALIARTVAERASAAASRPETILLAPTLPYGASDHHLPFGGTLSLGVNTFQLVLADLLASAAAAGVRRAFVLNAHGGNAAACAVAVAEAAREHGLIAGTALIGALVDGSGHAGVFETSVMLAVDPALARMDRAAPSPGGPTRTRPPGVVVAEPGRWQELDGYTDRPDEATAERGVQALEECVAAAAAAFEHVADIRA
jgi:creatinine amidohydrolase